MDNVYTVDTNRIVNRDALILHFPTKTDTVADDIKWYLSIPI